MNIYINKGKRPDSAAIALPRILSARPRVASPNVKPIVKEVTATNKNDNKNKNSEANFVFIIILFNYHYYS